MMRNTIRAESGLREPTPQERADPLFVQSVERALKVLAAFHETERPLTLTNIAQRAEIDRSAVQRMVHTLRALGYLRRDVDGHGYIPGLRLLDHTLDTLRLDPLVRRAAPILLELRRSVRERVDLSLFDDLRVIYAMRLQTKRQTFNSTLVGHSVPIFCSSGGWAILSRLPEDRARAILERSDRRPFTPHTLSDPDEIMEEVRATRQRGYALASNQILVGEIVAGFPVMGADGLPVGAIHVAGSLSEWTAEDYAAFVVPFAEEAARAISLY
jgi:IclR family pca regulon transcriptional regulator